MIAQKTLRRRKRLQFKTIGHKRMWFNTTLSQSKRKNTFQSFPPVMNKAVIPYSNAKSSAKHGKFGFPRNKKKDFCLLLSQTSSSVLVKPAEKYYWSGLVGIYWLCYFVFSTKGCYAAKKQTNKKNQLILNFLV